MNAELLKKINEEVQNGAFGAICTVIHESGSTPRSRGASMWVRPDGTFAARKLECWSNQGAYASHGHGIAAKGMNSFPQIYPCPNIECDSWTAFTNKYHVGSVATVTIVKLMPFGAFAEVLPGVDGLIHISQIANRRIGKPEDVLTVGDVVDAKVTAIDEEKHKISLSIRALSEPAPAPAAEVEEEEEDNGEDALVYEVSATGEATGIVPEMGDEE